MMTLPPKPPYGHACNQCGACCQAELCVIATDVAGLDQTPCPALELESGRYWCGIVRTPSRWIGTRPVADDFMGEMLRNSLGFGQGCDMDDAEPWEGYMRC